MAPQHLSFTVRTWDVCVLCLKKCPLPSSTFPEEKYTSFQAISQYLNLDLREIFNIKRLPGGEDKQAEIDVDVMLCRSCSEWRKVFYELYGQYKEIQQKMDSCLKGMHKVMVGAEGNVGNVKEYFRIIGEGSNSLEKVKGSIPEKFRRATITKCSQIKSEPDIKNDGKDLTINLKCNEQVVSDGAGASGEYDDFEDEFLKEHGIGVTGEPDSDTEGGINVEEISTSPDDKSQQDDDDDDEDPEALMIKYHSKNSTGGENGERGGGHRNSDEEMDMEEDENPISNVSEESNENEYFGEDDIDDGEILELDEDDLELNDEGDGTPTTASTITSSTNSGNSGLINIPGNKQKLKRYGRPGSYGAKYECELCGKVVVSLKNFELHQRRHAGEKPFECEYCTKTFRDTSNLRSHVLRYHRHYIFIRFKDPEVSMEEFQTGLNFLISSILTTVTPNEKSSTKVAQGCHLCQQFYTQRYAIEDHIVQRHYDVLGMSISNLQKEIKTLTADECLFYMTQMMAEGSTARSCGSCGLRFDSAERLNFHVKSHIKVNLIRNKGQQSSAPASASGGNSLIKLKMKCEPCGRYFEDLAALNRHKTTPFANGGCSRRPGKDALFQCVHCGKCLNTPSSQRRHMLSLHRYQVFAKYLPPGFKAAEVEDTIKLIFDSNKPQRSQDGFKCFICDKVITQYRKLSGHVLLSHFNDMVMLVKRILRERRAGQEPSNVAFINNNTGQVGTVTNNGEGDDDDAGSGGIEVIEIDSDDENDDAPKVLRVVDLDSAEVLLGNEGQYVDESGGNADVEYVMDKHANISQVNEQQSSASSNSNNERNSTTATTSEATTVPTTVVYDPTPNIKIEFPAM